MVIWSRPAQQDLRLIHDFIAKDSRRYAKKVSADILQASEELLRFPKKGRIVPEIDDPSVREIFLYSYRLIYQLSTERIEVLAVIHFKRDLTQIDLVIR